MELDQDYPCLMMERIVTRFVICIFHVPWTQLTGSDLNEIADMCA